MSEIKKLTVNRNEEVNDEPTNWLEMRENVLMKNKPFTVSIKTEADIAMRI